MAAVVFAEGRHPYATRRSWRHAGRVSPFRGDDAIPVVRRDQRSFPPHWANPQGSDRGRPGAGGHVRRESDRPDPAGRRSRAALPRPAATPHTTRTALVSSAVYGAAPAG